MRIALFFYVIHVYRLMETLRYNDSNRLFSGHELDMFSNILMFSIKQPTYIIYKRLFIFLFIHKKNRKTLFSDSVEIRKLILDIITNNIRIRLDLTPGVPVCVHTEYRVVYIGGRAGKSFIGEVKERDITQRARVQIFIMLFALDTYSREVRLEVIIAIIPFRLVTETDIDVKPVLDLVSLIELRYIPADDGFRGLAVAPS